MGNMPTVCTSSAIRGFLKNRYFLGSLWASVFLAVTALPPVMIDNASHSSRVTWFAFLAVMTCVGAFGAVAASFSANEIEKPKENHPLLPYYLMLLLYAVTVVFSVLIANATDGTGNVASAARTMTNFIEPVFFWISNFRETRVGWGMSELQILKTESITALWFLFGALLVLLLFGQRAMLTPAQSEYEGRYVQWMARNDRMYKSGFLTFCVVVFGFLMVSEFLGWVNFDVEKSYGRDCIISVHCYYANDLAILAAAGAKLFAIFGFCAGAIVIIREFFAQRM